MPRRKMERHRVAPRRRRDRVGEIPPPLRLVQLRIVGPPHRLRVRRHLPAVEVVVRAPPVAVVGVVRRLPCQQTLRPHARAESRQNLDRRQRRIGAVFTHEFQVQLAIVCRREPRKHAIVGNPLAARIRHHVEVSQQRLPVCAHRHQPAALAAHARVFRPVLRLGKVQADLVHAALQRNVVPELSFAARVIEARIERARDVSRFVLHFRAAREPRIGTPQLVCMIGVAPRRSRQDPHLIARRRPHQRLRNRLCLRMRLQRLRRLVSRMRREPNPSRQYGDSGRPSAPHPSPPPPRRRRFLRWSFRGRLRLRFRQRAHKVWHVLPHWNHNPQLVRRSLAGVVVRQPLAQPVHLYPHNRVCLLVELRPAAEHLHSDRIFLDLSALAGKELLAQITQQVRQGRRLAEGARLQHGAQFFAPRLHFHRLRVSGCRHRRTRPSSLLTPSLYACNPAPVPLNRHTGPDGCDVTGFNPPVAATRLQGDPCFAPA